MHTPYDTIDKIDTELLEKLCLVLTDALEEHDSNFFKWFRTIISSERVVIDYKYSIENK